MRMSEILYDAETANLKKGEICLFSDSYLALKHYDCEKSNIENNKLNKKYGYVFKGKFHGLTKRGKYPFMFESNCELDPTQPIIECTIFIAKIE